MDSFKKVAIENIQTQVGKGKSNLWSFRRGIHLLQLFLFMKQSETN